MFRFTYTRFKKLFWLTVNILKCKIVNKNLDFLLLLKELKSGQHWITNSFSAMSGINYLEVRGCCSHSPQSLPSPLHSFVAPDDPTKCVDFPYLNELVQVLASSMGNDAVKYIELVWNKISSRHPQAPLQVSTTLWQSNLASHQGLYKWPYYLIL